MYWRKHSFQKRAEARFSRFDLGYVRKDSPPGREKTNHDKARVIIWGCSLSLSRLPAPQIVPPQNHVRKLERVLEYGDTFALHDCPSDSRSELMTDAIDQKRQIWMILIGNDIDTITNGIVVLFLFGIDYVAIWCRESLCRFLVIDSLCDYDRYTLVYYDIT